MNFKNHDDMNKLLIFAFAAILFASCGSTTKATAYYTYNTQCLGTELDGSQTLLAWGEGRNRSDAIEQAKKNAVRDVIFKGIHAGKTECTQVPLVNTPNAQQRYEEYFNIFFADGGEYLKYVSMADQKSGSKDKEAYQYGKKISVTVRVLRFELKRRLQDDGILPR